MSSFNISPSFIPIFTGLVHVADIIMQYVTDEEDRENLCLAGGLQVRKIVFRKQKLLRNEKILEVANKTLIKQVFEHCSPLLGKLFCCRKD